MRSEFIRLLYMKQFLTVRQLKNKKNNVKLHLREPSKLLMNNIHANWLQYNLAKSEKHHIPVFLDEATINLKQVPTIFAIMEQELQEYDKNKALDALFTNFSPLKQSLLKFNLVVPKQDAMQYLIQWQRYRKYWWSSVSNFSSQSAHLLITEL